MTATKQAHITVEDYFALEEKEADIRHEYCDGAGADGSKPHKIAEPLLLKSPNSPERDL